MHVTLATTERRLTFPPHADPRLYAAVANGGKMRWLSSLLYLAGLDASEESRRGTYQGGLCDYKAALPTHRGREFL